MKGKKKHKKTLKRIQEELSRREGLLKPAGYSCNHKPMMKGEFPIGDNDELLFSISCLLKTCVLALEGDTTFSSSAISNADPKSNVIVALEFIINLLPREQMVLLDEITQILSEVEYKKV
ncbi:hypothetical protein [Cellulophaga sp. Hel_I_12]|uniref:hypothetical protein n=1 Tax=Cellulophaga sp. Hel_I_12 TaxID=1249972 RepID=UPI000645EB87|nr:hypothetical protein [Cellulophaga sp. Hel_I_12]